MEEAADRVSVSSSVDENSARARSVDMLSSKFNGELYARKLIKVRRFCGKEVTVKFCGKEVFIFSLPLCPGSEIGQGKGFYS